MGKRAIIVWITGAGGTVSLSWEVQGWLSLSGVWRGGVNWKGIVVKAGDAGLKKLGFWVEVELGGRLEERDL